MRVLIAEDDAVSRRVLQATLTKLGFDVTVTVNGREALEALETANAPRLAVLDWMMPEMDGLEVCRRLRATPREVPTYVLLLTACDSKQQIVAGLESGADDYLTKPFDRDELRARLLVGQRMVKLQEVLSLRVRELQASLAQVSQLQGLLPICCYCKKIRDNENYWQQVESYIAARSEANFTHGICPDCFVSVIQPQLDSANISNADACQGHP
jgi:sigma-B regulation protein RsbU (phosphoserine phosphatase)